MSKIRAWYGRGSLMVSERVEHVTQDLASSYDPAGGMAFYAGRYFVCETITKSAARAIADAMGWEWTENADDMETAV
jgi:hypothetical protein